MASFHIHPFTHSVSPAATCVFCSPNHESSFSYSPSAHDVAQSRQHKSISASDVIKALEIMQFRTVSLKCQDELNGKPSQVSYHLFVLAKLLCIAYRELAKQAEAKPKIGPPRKTANTNASGNVSSALASSKGKGKERAVPAIPLPPPFTSAPLPLDASEDAEQGPQHSIESISAGGRVEEREDEPMDLDTQSDALGILLYGSSASASSKGKGKERAVPAIPLPLPLDASEDAEQGPQHSVESISAGGLGEKREDKPMDLYFR